MTISETSSTKILYFFIIIIIEKRRLIFAHNYFAIILLNLCICVSYDSLTEVHIRISNVSPTEVHISACIKTSFCNQ